MTKTITPAKLYKIPTHSLCTQEKSPLFFDIETTGFSSKTTQLYMIGAACRIDGEFQVIQWFCEQPGDEPLVLAEFFKFLSDFDVLIHFNGEGFDMPYLINKCMSYNLPYDFSGVKSVDIFKMLRPFSRFLKLDNLKQKTIEDFLDIAREDAYPGGELINVYNRYLKNPCAKDRHLLFLHNFEDVCGLISILDILNYGCILDGSAMVTELEVNTYIDKNELEQKEAIFTVGLSSSLPKRISYGSDAFYFTAFHTTLRLKVKIYTKELKYFYPNYKDYYYLPYEDTSIHKSVAFYVDKNYRTRAKAANCYSKKTGTFLPQSHIIVEPYFKIDFYDKITYFELEDTFKNNPALQNRYVLDVLSHSLL